MPNPYFSKPQKLIIQQRAKFRCEYCQILEDYVEAFENEHIQPQSKGGDSSLDNMARACRICNLHKYNKTEGFDEIMNQMARLYNPRLDNWKDHFLWDEDDLHILGKTSIGRATIHELKLNRKKLIFLRQALIILGKHPPEDLL